MQAFAQIFNKLIRHYKYLEKCFKEEVKKLLLFLKGFSFFFSWNVNWHSPGTLNASILHSLYNETG